MVDIKDEEDYTVLEEMAPAFDELKHDKVVDGWQHYRGFCNNYHEVEESEKDEIRTYHQKVTALNLTVKETEMFFKVRMNDWFFWLVEFIPGRLGRLLYGPLSFFTENFIKKNVQDELFYNSIRYAFFTFLSPFYTLLIWGVLLSLLPIAGLMNQLMLLAVLISLGLFSISWSRYNLKVATVFKVNRVKKNHTEHWNELVSIRNNWRKRYEK
jgi:hypothetical protein